MNDSQDSVKKPSKSLSKALMRFAVDLMLTSVVNSAKTSVKNREQQMKNMHLGKMDSNESVSHMISTGQL